MGNEQEKEEKMNSVYEEQLKIFTEKKVITYIRYNYIKMLLSLLYKRID